ncbi:PTS lactose transporter subunit IIBC [Companilactobacillus pabuli]|jgi:PTS system lactose-specific IIC component|uniref:PTS system lactose-specific EIICB component n=1 Tax=Companilactobacillus pabuli TaxID=2714036 RepID=A0A7L7KX21_9LACO|nr:PTS lactose transporter subunit IIBC [Companilactobacillus pabuli]AKP04041.1 PTS lactose transporter subunit IIB [Companilactobacillus farciminis]AKS52346.1 PTS lactose transporter subunit IIB [Companilactobacillus farciminis]MDG5113307.1 PTS lactose transporter subunit IIBC [Companilactobacillus pabuli]QMT83892.1 PTS transporter subunit EIIC [Companilactobacillus pabuli]
MDVITNRIEKMKPGFEKIASNAYVSAIRDGFIAAMPIILFSSLFILVAYVPNAWGYHWPTNVENNIMIAYNYSMGLLALFVTATTAKNLTDTKNLDLPKTNQMNSVSIIMAAEIAFIISSIVQNKGGADLTYLGTQGLVASYLVGLIVPNIYYICIKNNVTIKMPPQVPQNISQTFKDVIPMFLSVTVFWAFSLLLVNLTGKNLAQLIIAILAPIFSASDSYIGLAIIAGAMGFFWFVGVQGPSIVAPAVSAIEVTNTAANLNLIQAGHQATHVLAQNAQDYVMNMGGTGSTFILVFLFLFLAKSKQLKALGKASFIPVSFSVNEPILFGAPIIMNPIFFIPFVVTPMVNICMFKFFIDVLGMNGMMYTMPWVIPAPIGILVSTGFAPLAFVFVLLSLVVDAFIWLPFMRSYDRDLLTAENKKAEEEGIATDDSTDETTDDSNDATVMATDESDDKDDTTLDKDTAVMVICAGGGTSGILANALNKMAKERDLPLSAAARAYGQDMNMIQDMDLVILAPQMESMKGNVKKITDKYGAKLATTSGKEYIELTRNPEKSLKFVKDHL